MVFKKQKKKKKLVYGVHVQKKYGAMISMKAHIQITIISSEVEVEIGAGLVKINLNLNLNLKHKDEEDDKLKTGHQDERMRGKSKTDVAQEEGRKE